MKISKKKLAGFLSCTLALTAIAGSWAYYSSTNTVDNQLQTLAYGDTLVERFTPDDDWQPGEEVTKEVAVKNTGDYDLVVRVKLSETWTRNGSVISEIDSTDTGSNGSNVGINNITVVSQTDASDGLTTGDQTVVEKTMAASGWTQGSDGYWYYNSKIASGESTSKLLEAITLTQDVDLGIYDTVKYYHEGTTEPTFEPGDAADTGTATGGWAVYTGEVPSPATAGNSIFTRTVSSLNATNSGYSGAIYDLIITSETCQATSDAVAATWTTAPSSVVSGWNL